MRPSLVRGGALLLFPDRDRAQRSERDPRRFLPITPPMDEVHGFFIRFAEVLVRCLCFHFFTYVVHAVSENHFKPALWAVTNSFNCPGPKIQESYGGSAPKPP